ncbi:MAG: DUF4956 domain-containing protein [Bacteroidales bacterium]|nr:DUF4956 domain-containing protein [Bacteroidales bacterium]MBN2820212.1 DUF4956 domain-containing protein [Bacteroidales bacterium]
MKESVEIFGIQLVDLEDFLELIIRFSFNLIVILIAVRVLYYPSAKRKDYLFTYILISTVVFLLCFLLDNVKLEIGFALGLFAIFGIIRYRTNPIPIKEMTYLFLVIGVSVINALANKKVSYAELIFTNLVILVVTFFLEKVNLIKHESTKSIEYERIDLITKDKREQLIKDLESRTGIKINRVEIGRINFLRDTVKLKIYYFEEDAQSIFHVDDYGTGSEGFE